MIIKPINFGWSITLISFVDWVELKVEVMEEVQEETDGTETRQERSTTKETAKVQRL